MRIYISGGCKNGKSTYAETFAVNQRPAGGRLFYAATMRPADAEDEARIARHRALRAGKQFETLEVPTALGPALAALPENSSCLVDSVTALLSNEMFSPGCAPDMQAPERVAAQLCDALERRHNLVLVSDYIYSDAVLYDELVQSYRRGLALVDKACAAICDVLVEVVSGQLVFYKGENDARTLL